MGKKEKIFGFLLIFLLAILPVSLLLTKKVQNLSKQAASEQLVPSFKKGVAGGATLSLLSQIKTSWFYNWAYIPTYKSGSGFNNWDPEIWKKFVPLFYGKYYLSVNTQIAEICKNTAYCNKGNYYLVGNEPDIEAQDKVKGATNAPLDAVTFQGEIIKRVLEKDPTAKFIILGLGSKDDSFVRNFIALWQRKWQGTPIENLPDIIKGWHFHFYTTACQTDDSFVASFAREIDGQMEKTYGRKVPDQEIWITEMGSLDNTDYQNLIACFVNTFEQSKIVIRYAWFYLGCNTQVHSFCNTPWSNYNLFYPAGSGFEISPLGQKYSTLGLIQSTNPTPTLTPAPLVSATPKPTGLPTSTSIPTPIASQSPTPVALTCDPGCFYGLAQCIDRITPKADYSCKINHSANFCPQCNSSTEEWCWAFCKNSTPTLSPTITPTAELTPSLTPFASLTPTPSTNPPNPTITLNPEVCPLKNSGDANCDNKIDVKDFFAWRREFLASLSGGSSSKQSDFNSDGRVNISDFFIWRRGFLTR